MFYLEGNEINITRGDTALIEFTLDNHEFVDGDAVYFSVKRSTKDTSYIINKEITNFNGNTATIELLSDDTRIPKGKYWYDIQCSLADGRVDTVVNKERFIILEDVNDE